MATSITKLREVLLLSLNDSIGKRSAVMDDLEQSVPGLLTALMDKAKGLWVEEAQPTPKGDSIRHVYQLRPDVKAARFLLELAGYEPGLIASTLLSFDRANVSYVQKTLTDAQKKLTLITAENTKRNTELSMLSMISTEEHLRMVDGLCQGFMQIIQAITQEEHTECGADDYKMMQWHNVMMGRLMRLLESEHQIKMDKALPPGENEEE